MSTPTRGHSLPLRLTIPPLRTLLGFACSVASLSRCPNHYPPGHHCLRGAALVECPLGQGEPSTRPEGRYGSTCTSLTSFHLDDRRTWPLPADRISSIKSNLLQLRFFLSNVFKKEGKSKICKKLFTLLDLCVSSLRRGHANLLCIVPILTDDPRRESKMNVWSFSAAGAPLFFLCNAF